MNLELLTGREIVARLNDKIAYTTLLQMAAAGRVRSYLIGKTGRRFVFLEVVEDLRRLAMPVRHTVADVIATPTEGVQEVMVR